MILHEDENATTPLKYLWETSKLTKGLHTVTVNMMSYDDHIGTATYQVWIGE